MKSKLKYILIGILMLCITTQILWYTRENGNLIIFVSNWSERNKNLEVIIEIDRKVLIEEKLEEETYHNYYKIPLKLKYGRHCIKIHDKNKSFFYEKNLFLFPVTWVTFEIHDNNSGGQEIFDFVKFIPASIE